jgi:hypothetical protein
MKKLFVFALAAAILCLIRPAVKAQKDRLEMLKGFELILRDESQMAGKVVSERGITMFLQSPKYGYEQGLDFFLFLRFQAEDRRHPVRFNLLGSFEIEMIDMTRATVQTGSYVFDDNFKKKLAISRREIVSIGSKEESVPEVVVIFSLEDFNLVPPADGVYRIKLTYQSQSPDNSVWTGLIDSKPILVSVGEVR